MARLFCFLVGCCLCCQLTAADLRVTAKILESGRTKDGRQGFMVHAQVRNDSETRIGVFMMNCAWDSSWFVSVEKTFGAYGRSCDRNFQEEFTFAPHSGYDFRFCVISRIPHLPIEGQRIKLGFAVIERSKYTFEDLFFMNVLFRRDSPRVLVHRPAAELPITWSEELQIPEITDRELKLEEHSMKELPSR